MKKSPLTINYSPSTSRGFTLIETLIYSALVAVVIGLLVTVAFEVISGNANLTENIFLEEEAGFILSKINWILSGTSLVNNPASGSISTSTLSINTFTVPSNESPVVFSLQNGKILMQRNNGSQIELNSAFVTVDNATFTHIAASGTIPAGITAEFAIRSTASSKARQYSITRYLRP